MAQQSARPRYETKPTPRAKTWLPAIRKAARRLGTELMPWQAKAARLLAELRPDGLPRWKTVIVSVPRQQGKTTLSRAAITAKAQSPGLALYGTAQSRQYAAKHVIALGDVVRQTASGLELVELRVNRGVGNEKVVWPNGSTYMPISPTEGGGHGDSIDFMLVDEGWALVPHVMGGIRPAMIARPGSQMLVISTMGTYESVVWNRLVEQGREAVEDPDSTMAYIEYSASSDEEVFDESRWGRWMPALGRTVSIEDVRSAIADLDPAEAIRAFGNRTTASAVSIFPAEWVEKAWRVMTPPNRMVLAVEVNDGPDGAAIATGHVTDDGGTAGRIVEWRTGPPSWVAKMVAEICERRTVEAVVADLGGPARVIRADLQAICDARFIPLEDRTPRNLGADTGSFFNGLRENTLYLERSDPLADALAAAYRKQLGDLWIIARRLMPVDASPLNAVIMATGLARELGVAPRIVPAIY